MTRPPIAFDSTLGNPNASSKRARRVAARTRRIAALFMNTLNTQRERGKRKRKRRRRARTRETPHTHPPDGTRAAERPRTPPVPPSKPSTYTPSTRSRSTRVCSFHALRSRGGSRAHTESAPSSSRRRDANAREKTRDAARARRARASIGDARREATTDARGGGASRRWAKMKFELPR